MNVSDHRMFLAVHLRIWTFSNNKNERSTVLKFYYKGSLYLKRERNRAVNVISGTFRTVDHVKYERFRQSYDPDRLA
jgi:hypothetical protein